MMRLRWMILAFLMAMPLGAHSKERTPNIILVMADDQGWGDTGYNGHPVVQTPTMDDMAKEGFVFDRFYAAAPLCSPTRASVMTGRNPNRSKTLDHGNYMRPHEHTIAETLKANGYVTGMFGKSHIGSGQPDTDCNPSGMGFDEWIIGLNFFDNDPYLSHNGTVKQRKGKGSVILMDDTLDFLTKHKDGGKPIFTVVWFPSPHVPHSEVPDGEAIYKDEKSAGYWRETTLLDQQLGRLRAELRKMNIAENTILWYCGDNGGLRKESSGGRARKRSMYEGGLRVPALMEWPARKVKGRSNVPVSTSDIYPTLMAMAGITPPADTPKLDGEDVSDIIFKGKTTRETGIGFWLGLGSGQPTLSDDLLKEIMDKQHADVPLPHNEWRMRKDVDDFKQYDENTVKGHAVWLDWPWKIHHTYKGVTELYNLEDDPMETSNLANDNAHHERSSRMMKERLRPWMASVIRSLNGEDYGKEEVNAAENKDKPNFIVVFTDDQGYQDLGCFGSPDIRTPRIDQMAKEGMKFTSFYGQTVCGPSRTALMTGSYPLRVAQKNNVTDKHPHVHSKEITIAEILKEQGYATGCFGKWDLAAHRQKNYHLDLLPTKQGFDYFFGTPTSNDNIVNLLRNEKVIEQKADMANLTKRYTDEAIAFIQKNKDTPFFVYIPHTMPHLRLAASEQFKGKSSRGLYGDVIEEIDFNVGRLIDEVTTLGLKDNTYIIFTSDNGPWYLDRSKHLSKQKDEGGSHGGNAEPLRGHKTSVWEGGVRVPTVMWAPGRIPAGKTCDAITSNMDLLPTFATLANGQIPDDRVIDGHDISGLMHGESGGSRKVLYHYGHTQLMAVRSGDWKLHVPRTLDVVERWSTFQKESELIDFSKPLLYNLADDIGETTNLATKRPDKVIELMALVELARKDIGDYNRVGKNARFYDKGPRRRDIAEWKNR